MPDIPCPGPKGVWKACKQAVTSCWGCRDEVVELKKDDLYVVRYRPIRELLAEKWVELI